MNPQCARCSKTVYPVEKLNCLDKYWHKKCFTCHVCNMKLTMKNYKGYNKDPYCNSHYPTTKFTAVADTPENLRLAKQTKNSSQVEYHKEFEKERGQVTSVTDDPETQRAKRATQQQSQAVYTKQNNPQTDHGTSYSEPAAARHIQPAQQAYQPPPVQQAYQPPPQPVQQQVRQPPQPVHQPPKQGSHRALYDYTAADDDEVSIMEGDFIGEVNIIDSGWMEGRNQRTGQFGMLPSNYVEEI